MKKVMYTVEEVSELILQGKNLLLAADEKLLRQLPDGNWIAGSIPYFMTSEGGKKTDEFIFLNEIPSFVEEVKITSYDIATIKNIYKDGYDNGFTVVIIPSFSETHLSFAINAPDYKDFATKPLMGWISGVAVEDIGKMSSKTFMKSGKSFSEKDAIAMHVKLPAKKYADISIINLFTQDTGAEIEFEESGFNVKNAMINGVKHNFADYILQSKLDTKLPLVADYNGTMINISIQSIDHENQIVNFYAPVFKGISYKFAKSINYIDEFSRVLADNESDYVFSCNCILNYLYSELEGKKTGNIMGPVTFGEIAYQLLNQTMVNLKVVNL